MLEWPLSMSDRATLAGARGMASKQGRDPCKGPEQVSKLP
jgi:hypothetical protein